MNLSLEEKISRIQNLKEKFGLNRTLKIIGVPKSTWYYHQNEKVDYEEKYAHVKEPLMDGIEKNPAYGWRKLKDELKDVYGIRINHKPLKKLLNLWGLALLRVVEKPRKNPIVKLIQEVGDRANLLKEMDLNKIEPFEVLITDFTWVYYHSGKKKAALIGYEDLAGKVIYGHAVGKSQDTALALEAWKKTKKTLKSLEWIPKE